MTGWMLNISHTQTDTGTPIGTHSDNGSNTDAMGSIGVLSLPHLARKIKYNEAPKVQCLDESMQAEIKPSS